MLDYLFVGAHPDDCEIFVGGAILHLKNQGFRVGILDLTRGEMGSYGTPEIRAKEMEIANGIMQIDFRKTLNLPDGSLVDTPENRSPVIEVLRQTAAKMVFSFPFFCRHPDHKATHEIVKSSIFLSGLERYEVEKKDTMPHRPDVLACFMEFYPLERISFVMDITPFYEKKKELVKCYSSQIISDENDQQLGKKSSFIRSPAFWDDFEGRSKRFGSLAGVRYAEAFFVPNPPHLEHPLKHFTRQYI